MVGLRRAWATVTALMALAGGAAPVRAHDFWIEPSTFRPEIGQPIGVRLHIGDGFKGWSVPRNVRRIEAFEVVGPGGAQPIVGRDGSDPAGIARFTRPGAYVIGYRSHPAFTEMEPAKFDEYLREKGLEEILALRAQRGRSEVKAREAYSRFSKSLIRVGGAPAGVADRAIGLRFEILAESTAGDFRLLFDGKPLQGALVAAVRRNADGEAIRARTDFRGSVKLPIGEPGVWLISSVHMLEARDGVAADWESFWASLTYELQP